MEIQLEIKGSIKGPNMMIDAESVEERLRIFLDKEYPLAVSDINVITSPVGKKTASEIY